jgi:predicted metalloprotease with PDZ domain
LKVPKVLKVPKAGGHEMIADARGTGGPAKDAESTEGAESIAVARTRICY